MISKSHGDKPILGTEAGSPGYGQRYEDCIAFCDREQIGFYLFEAMIGVDRFRDVSGLFFPDSSIRELDPLLEFQALAQRQGVTATRRYRIAEYTRCMARNDVTEMTWHERTTAIYSGLTRSASAEERDLGIKRLETARAAYARGDRATAFEIATSMMKEMTKK